MSWHNPQPGERYRRFGYVFEVSRVSRRCVYGYRWRWGGGSYSDVQRAATLEQWRKQMAGAKPLGRKGGVQ